MSECWATDGRAVPVPVMSTLSPRQTDARRRHGLKTSRPRMHMSGAGGASLQRSYVGLSATACRSAAAAASPASSASVCSMAVMSRWGPSTPSSSTSAGEEVAAMVGGRVWSQIRGSAGRTNAAGCLKRLGRGRQEGRLAASRQGSQPLDLPTEHTCWPAPLPALTLQQRVCTSRSGGGQPLPKAVHLQGRLARQRAGQAAVISASWMAAGAGVAATAVANAEGRGCVRNATTGVGC